MAVIPPVRVNGLTPRPDGNKADSQLALDATAIPLTLASTVGISALEWQIGSKPEDATTTIASANPAAPFSTTFGPLNKKGTYLLKAIANGDAESVKEFAITVLSDDGIRIPALGEDTQWDATQQYLDNPRDVVLGIEKRRIGRATATFPSDANYTIPSPYTALKKRCVDIAGTITVQRDLVVPLNAFDDGWWMFRNTCAFGVRVIGPTGTGVVVPVGGALILASDGTNIYDVDSGDGGGGGTVTASSVSVGSAPATSGGNVLLTDGAGNGLVFGTSNREAVVRESNEIKLGNANDVTAVRGATIDFEAPVRIGSTDDAALTTESTVKATSTTTDTANVVIGSITPPNSSSGEVIVPVVGVKSDHAATYVQAMRMAYKKVAGTVTLIGAVEENTAKTDGTTAGIDISAVANAGAIDIRVTGRLDEVFRWAFSYELLHRTTAA